MHLANAWGIAFQSRGGNDWGRIEFFNSGMPAGMHGGWRVDEGGNSVQ